ncbi:MAG: RidA family protein [Actinomycetota bacterium]
MERIETEGAPQAIGPYSQAIRAADLVFCSGQIGLDPHTGDLADASIAGQTRRVLENLGAVLGAAGLGLGDVVKTTVYLVRMDDFAAMNEVYAEFFGTPPPARATVAVAALPRGALVEIDALAARPSV